MPGQAGHYCDMSRPLSKTLKREKDARKFVNPRFPNQKLVNVCQSMEKYSYICYIILNA